MLLRFILVGGCAGVGCEIGVVVCISVILRCYLLDTKSKHRYVSYNIQNTGNKTTEPKKFQYEETHRYASARRLPGFLIYHLPWPLRRGRQAQTVGSPSARGRDPKATGDLLLLAR